MRKRTEEKAGIEIEEFEGIDLEEIDIGDAELEEIDLEEELEEIDLGEEDLEEIDLEDAKLEEIDLEETEPEEAESAKTEFIEGYNLKDIEPEKRGPGRAEPGAKRRRKKKRRLLPAVICILLLGLLGGGWLYVDSLFYKTVRVEAGIPVEASDFMKKPSEEAFFTQDSQPFDIAEPGTYRIRVKSGFFTHRCTLIIEDSIPPQALTQPVSMEVGDSCKAEAFVTEITDATQVEASFRSEPDFEKAGEQTVQIVLTDRGGNQTVLEEELYLVLLAESVTVEAGGKAPGLDSFVLEGRDAAFITQVDQIDYAKTGDHEISLEVDGNSYTSLLHVVDTVPPRIQVQDVESYTKVPRKAEDFLAEVEDATEVTASFRKEPDLSLVGSQEVEIVATDGGGNEVSATATLTLREDTEAPVIHGPAKLNYFIGESISYKNQVAVTDNCEEGLNLDVDTSGVNLAEEGVYQVVYTATDAAGNTASKTVELIVGKRMYSLEEMNAYADKVLEQIITPDMDDKKKAKAIYDYVVRNVAYINHSEKGDWIRAAYEGLAEKKGDCYVFACTTKALLTRAGITNMDIKKIPTRSEHYWNLVDVGEGWYHLDTTPRPDHPTIFLWTDEQLMAYSAIHYNAFNYDRSLYPEIN